MERRALNLESYEYERVFIVINKDACSRIENFLPLTPKEPKTAPRNDGPCASLTLYCQAQTFSAKYKTMAPLLR
jgi:hypothetical protein